MQVIDFGQVDWNTSWKAVQHGRGAIGDPAKWDARADSFAKRKISPYSERFVELLAAREGESVLDMGCGTGELAIMLASKGHPVTAADFSTGMLSQLESALAAREPLPVTPLQMSWTDDWPAHGVEAGSVDIAIASRSIMVPDLAEALGKLSSTARRKVAITLCAGASPGEDVVLLEAIGRGPAGRYDVPFCMNILFSQGYFPEITYIDADKKVRYASIEEALDDSISRISEITPQEKQTAEEFLRSHLVTVDDGEGGQAFTFDYPRVSNWAFISWEV